MGNLTDKKSITVVTEALRYELTPESLKRCYWDYQAKFFRFLKKIPPKPKYSGHYAVTRSLIEGLKRLNANFNYNPASYKHFSDTVIVLSHPDALIESIKLKKKGKIKKLLAGPNIVVFSTDFNNLIAAPEIDTCIVPSEWVRVAYIEDVPALKDRIDIWSAGIDETFWKPGPEIPETNNVLIYWKTEPEEFYLNVKELLLRNNWNPVTLKYGEYTQID